MCVSQNLGTTNIGLPSNEPSNGYAQKPHTMSWPWAPGPFTTGLDASPRVVALDAVEAQLHRITPHVSSLLLSTSSSSSGGGAGGCDCRVVVVVVGYSGCGSGVWQ